CLLAALYGRSFSLLESIIGRRDEQISGLQEQVAALKVRERELEGRVAELRADAEEAGDADEGREAAAFNSGMRSGRLGALADVRRFVLDLESAPDTLG